MWGHCAFSNQTRQAVESTGINLLQSYSSSDILVKHFNCRIKFEVVYAEIPSVVSLPSAGCVITSFVGDLFIGERVCGGALCRSAGLKYLEGRTSFAILTSVIKYD